MQDTKLQPLNTTHGVCRRCGVSTVRFAADEERFEVGTNVPHTPSRCERRRLEAEEDNARATQADRAAWYDQDR